MVAADIPDRITGLVLGNTEIPGHTPWLVGMYATLMRVPGSKGLFRRLLGSRWFRRSRWGFGGCFADRDYLDGEFHDLLIAPLLREPDRLKNHLALLANADLRELRDMDQIHARIPAPVRLVWGTDDPFFPLEGARNMAPQLPGFEKLVEIPGGKLFAHEEFAAQFAEASAELLRGVAGAGAMRERAG